MIKHKLLKIGFIILVSVINFEPSPLYGAETASSMSEIVDQQSTKDMSADMDEEELYHLLSQGYAPTQEKQNKSSFGQGDRPIRPIESEEDRIARKEKLAIQEKAYYENFDEIYDPKSPEWTHRSKYNGHFNRLERDEATKKDIEDYERHNILTERLQGFIFKTEQLNKTWKLVDVLKQLKTIEREINNVEDKS